MTSKVSDSIAGVVLAGGLSTRMGGGDKALTRLGDEPLVARVIDRLAPQVGTIAINANGAPDRFSAFGLPVIADEIPGHAGPLAGILTAMRWARQAHGATHVVTVAADTPFFPPDLVERLRALVTGPNTIAMARSSIGLHPVFALWPTDLADDLESWLQEQDTRKVTTWARRHALAACDFEPLEHDIDPFFNINTPDDLAAAEAILKDENRMNTKPRVIGIVGWKNSGKTRMVAALVRVLTARGRTVSTIKHAHHAFDIDREGADSWQHRQAGAREVAIVSARRWALMHEIAPDASEPPLAAMLDRLSPCDIVIIEGYKRDAHDKIEIRRAGAANTEPLTSDDGSIVAIVSDDPGGVADDLPVFGHDAVDEIADFVERHTGLVETESS